MYEGRAPVEAGLIFGHENMGVIEAVGSAVRNVKVGDRVVLPFNIGCGFCFNCTRGFSNACLTVNPQGHGGGYGYSGMGPHPGGQAELVRVPYADYNALALPGTPGDEFEDDFILLADVFPTGYHATEQAHVKPGDTVAIFGAGPVGLMAALSCKSVQDLQKGAGEKMPGVMCTIDAIGYEAKKHDTGDRKNEGQQDPEQLLADLVRLTNPTGHISLIGVYFPEDPGAKGDAKKGRFLLDLGDAWNKGITIEMGQAPVKQYNVYLRDLIIAGVAKPSTIVSHRFPLDGAVDAYKNFDARNDGYTKVLLKPQQAA